MFTLDVQLDSSTAIRALLSAERAMDMASLTGWMEREAIPHLQRRASERFATEGDDASRPWADLKATTQAWRASYGFPPAHPINVRTGTLRGWLLANQGDNVSTTHIAKYNWPTNPEGWTERKFKTAQRGWGRKPKTEPRPVVAASETDLTTLLSGIAHWVAFRSDIELT